VTGVQTCALPILVVLGLTEERYLDEGAVAAMFYYGLHRALEKKARYFDFGLSRPFISDGVCIYKRKWGGRIQRNPEIHRVMYLKNIWKDGLVILEGEKLKVLMTPGNTVGMQYCTDEGLEAKVV
jgi:hypothetical protein